MTIFAVLESFKFSEEWLLFPLSEKNSEQAFRVVHDVLIFFRGDRSAAVETWYSFAARTNESWFTLEQHSASSLRLELGVSAVKTLIVRLWPNPPLMTTSSFARELSSNEPQFL